MTPDDTFVDPTDCRLYHSCARPPCDSGRRSRVTRPRSGYEPAYLVAVNFEVRTMSRDVLQQAEDAIAAKIREADQPMDTSVVLGKIVDETSLDEFDLRAAVWRLIGRGTIVLTEDRRLASTGTD